MSCQVSDDAHVPAQFEADRRAITITINSLGTDLSKDQRGKLYPTCGRLYPEGLSKLARVDDMESVRSVVEQYAVCQSVCGVSVCAQIYHDAVRLGIYTHISPGIPLLL